MGAYSVDDWAVGCKIKETIWDLLMLIKIRLSAPYETSVGGGAANRCLPCKRHLVRYLFSLLDKDWMLLSAELVGT
jgi:hypothetical protein